MLNLKLFWISKNYFESQIVLNFKKLFVKIFLFVEILKSNFLNNKYPSFLVGLKIIFQIKNNFIYWNKNYSFLITDNFIQIVKDWKLFFPIIIMKKIERKSTIFFVFSKLGSILEYSLNKYNSTDLSQCRKLRPIEEPRDH